MGETFVMKIHKCIQQIVIESDSQLLVNFLNGRIRVQKNIINSVEVVKCLLPCFNDRRMKYYNRVINKDANVLAKRFIKNFLLYFVFFG